MTHDAARRGHFNLNTPERGASAWQALLSMPSALGEGAVAHANQQSTASLASSRRRVDLGLRDNAPESGGQYRLRLSALTIASAAPEVETGSLGERKGNGPVASNVIGLLLLLPSMQSSALLQSATARLVGVDSCRVKLAACMC
ncbi:hypothetical protein PHYPSEUDO_001135 [Phytophthora pseudosyringae]|uniref:Uncharacterized protein n=1 Tax=Phytophthora pseudosyringae TaxID=221518 RepID=A0A8T1V3H1_9STRA|nr:hypothetical protein PHYPSEUDO_001135 [Phytophthora pseudosyringae]